MRRPFYKTPAFRIAAAAVAVCAVVTVCLLARPRGIADPGAAPPPAAPAPTPTPAPAAPASDSPVGQGLAPAAPAAAAAPAPTLRGGVYEGQYFNITIDTETGVFRFLEALYSSHLSCGAYTVTDGVLTIRDPWPAETGPVDRVNRFRVEDGALVWLAEGSDNFVFVTLTDGATFRLKTDGA